MSVKWHRAAEGVRYREHPTRKWGSRKDRYYTIYYWITGEDNKRHKREEAIGWASESKDSIPIQEKAVKTLLELKENARLGKGPVTLKDKREEHRRHNEEERKRQEQEKETVTIMELFENRYFPNAGKNKKPGSMRAERLLFERWIKPVIGRLPLNEVSPGHLETIKGKMATAGKAAATIRYCLATVRQAFNFAARNDLFSGVNPVSKVKQPRLDNRKIRYFTPTEAEKLIKALRERSEDVADMTVISLYTGMRFSEVAALEWRDIDFDTGQILVRHANTERNRHVDMAQQVRMVLERRERGKRGQLIFQGKKGPFTDLSRTFRRTVEALGLNKGITERLNRVTFHSLRHTAASWMREQGIDLSTIRDILGHRNLASTQRYSSMQDDARRHAIEALERQAMNREKSSPVKNEE